MTGECPYRVSRWSAKGCVDKLLVTGQEGRPPLGERPHRHQPAAAPFIASTWSNDRGPQATVYCTLNIP